MPKSINKKEANLKGMLAKRTASLAGGAVKNYFTEAMPIASQTFSDAKDIGSNVVSRLRTAKTTVSNVAKSIRSQSPVKAILNWYMGEEDEYGDSNFDDIDDADMTFDIPTDDDSDSGDKIESSVGSIVTEKASNKISGSIVSAAHQQVEANIELTSNILSSIEKQSDVIAAGFDNVNNNLNGILEVVTKNTAALVETTILANKEKEKDVGGEMVSSGKFKLKDYGKNIYDNIMRTSIGPMLSFLPMLTNPTLLKSMLEPEEIVKNIFSFGMNKLFPKLQEGLEELDTALSETIIGHLLELGQAGYDEGIWGEVKKVFGIQSKREEFYGGMDYLSIEKVPFDSLTREAIVSTIPGYLAKILEAIGGEKLIYDYRRRSFTTRDELQEEFMEEATNTRTQWQAPDSIRKAFGSDDFGRMVFDAIMTDLGSKSSNMWDKNKSSKSIIASFGEEDNFKKYIQNEIFKPQDIEMTDAVTTRLERMGQAIQNIFDDDFTRNMNILVAKNNIRRNKHMQDYIQDLRNYNIDIGNIRTMPEIEIQRILNEGGYYSKNGKRFFNANLEELDEDDIKEIYEKNRKDTNVSEGEISPTEIIASPIVAKKQEPEYSDDLVTGKFKESATSGINYTNWALYEIFRTLNRGINVFKVGEKKKGISKPYPDWAKEGVLPAPLTAKIKNQNAIKYKDRKEDEEEAENPLDGRFSDEEFPNLLKNQTDAEGNTEDLSKVERFNRWSKDRLPKLLKAVLSGNPKAIHEAVGLIGRDVGQVGGEFVHNKVEEFNLGYGNIVGYLNHKLTGKGYSYKDKDEDGNVVDVNVADNEKGGIIGFLKSEIKDKFSDKSAIASRWFNDVKSYFAPEGAQESEDVKKRRGKLIAASIGALGGGILGGPIGILMGTIAGSALGSIDVPEKLKEFLFGRDENDNPTGILTKFSDAIISPIKYQFGKTASLLGTILKKNFLGPLSDLGIAIKDRITNIAENFSNSAFGKIFKFIGDVITAPFRAAARLFKLPVMIAGGLTRTAAKAAAGVTGGLLGTAASIIAGKSEHEVKNEETGEIEKISTREFIKRRRAKRKEELKNEGKFETDAKTGEILKDDEGNEVKSRYSSYKAYREYEKKERARRKAKWEEYTGNVVESRSIIEPKDSENLNKTAEATEQAAEDVGVLRKLGEEEGSIFTHDQGLHDKLDQLNESFSKFIGNETYTPFIESEESSNEITSPENKEEVSKEVSTQIGSKELSTGDIIKEKLGEAKISEVSKEPEIVEDIPNFPISQIIKSTWEKAKEDSTKESEEDKYNEKDETSVHAYEVSPEDRFNADEAFANSAVSAAAAVVTAGGISDDDEKVAGEIVKEASKDDSNAGIIENKLTDLLGSQHEGNIEKEKEEKEDKSLFTIIGDKVAGIADWFLNTDWGKMLGAIATITGIGLTIGLIADNVDTIVGTVQNIWGGIKNVGKKIADAFDLEKKIDYLINELGVLFGLRDADNHDAKDKPTEGSNAVTGMVADAVVKDAYDIVTPGGKIYHMDRDGAGELIENQSAETARDTALFKIPAINAIHDTWKAIKSRDAGLSYADQASQYRDTSQALLSKAAQYRANGDIAMAEKYEQKANKMTEKASDMDEKSAAEYKKVDEANNTGATLVHGLVKNYARVGVMKGVSTAVGKGAEWVAQKAGFSEETSQRAGEVATRITAAGLTANSLISSVTKKTSIVDKILEGLLKMLQFIAKKLKVYKVFAKVIGKIDGIVNKIYNCTVGKITNKISKAVEAAYVKVTGKSLAGSASFGIMIAAGACSGLASGLCGTEHLFGVMAGEADPMMKTISGIMGTVFGALEWTPGLNAAVVLIDIIDTILIAQLGCGIKQYIARELYKLLTGEEGTAKLESMHAEMNESLDTFNQMHGTDLTMSEYNDMMNESRGWVARLWNGKSEITEVEARDENGEIIKDENGNPKMVRVLATDEAGGQLSHGLKERFFGSANAYVHDAEGNVIRGEDGSAIKAVDATGNVLRVQRDENGEIIKDENGNPIYTNNIGNKLSKGWNGVKRFFAGGQTYKTDENGVALVDENGNYIIDEENENKGFIDNSKKLAVATGKKFVEVHNAIGEKASKFADDFANGVVDFGKDVAEKWDGFIESTNEIVGKIQDWSYNISIKMEDGFKSFVDGGAKVFKSIPQSISKLWGYIKTGDLSGWSSSKGPGDDSVSGKIANGVYFGIKMITSTAMLVSNGAHKLYDGIKTIAGGGMNVIKSIPESISKLWGYLKSGDLAGWIMSQGPSDDGSISGMIGNAIYQVGKYFTLTPMLVSTVAHLAYNGIKGIGNAIKSNSEIVQSGHNKISTLSASGDLSGLLAANLTTDDGDPASGFGKAVFTIDKIVHFVPALIHFIGNNIQKKFENIVNTVKSSKSNLDKSIETLGTVASTGDMDALGNVNFKEDENSPLNGITKAIFVGAKLISHIPAFPKWVGNKVSGIWDSLSSDIATNKSSLDSAISSIGRYASDGNISGIWSVKTSFKPGDPLKPFWGLALIIGKVFNSIKGLFGIIGKKLGDLVESMSDIPIIGNVIDWIRGNNGKSINEPLTDNSNFSATTMRMGGEIENNDIVEKNIPKSVSKSIPIGKELAKQNNIPVGDGEGGNPLSKEGIVTSTFGPRTYPRKGMHKGIDIAPKDGSENADVQSRFSGTISYVRNNVSNNDTATKENGSWEYNGNKSGGNMVWIDTDDGLRVKNMHLKASSIPNDIQPGTHVEVGDKIGEIGSTGFSTGPHLHYQIEKNNGAENTPLNPSKTLNVIKGLSPKQRRMVTGVGDPEDDSTQEEIGQNISSMADATTESNSFSIMNVINGIKEFGSRILYALTGGLLGSNSSESSTNDGSLASEYSSALSGGAIVGTGGAEAVLNVARNEIGYKEIGNADNRTKYCQWYYGKDKAEKWCMIFVQWCFDKAGYPLQDGAKYPAIGGYERTASCSGLREWYRKNYPSRIWETNRGQKIPTPEPADVIIICNGSHTGIVECDNGDGTTFTTIEGNTTNNKTNDVQWVARKPKRKRSDIVALIRPFDWKSMAQTNVTTNGTTTSSGSFLDTLTSFVQGQTNKGTTASSTATQVAQYGEFPKYNLNDTQLRGIARILHEEQPDKPGRQAEASLIANHVDVGGNDKATSNRLVAFIRGTPPYDGQWLYNGRKRFDNPGSVSSSDIEIARDVLVRGHRTLPRYVNEHDMLGDSKTSDIISVSNNGKTFNKFSKSQYIPHVTQVKQDPKRFKGGGITWTYALFPSQSSDPFGYTSAMKKKREQWGDKHWPSGGELETDSVPDLQTAIQDNNQSFMKMNKMAKELPEGEEIDEVSNVPVDEVDSYIAKTFNKSLKPIESDLVRKAKIIAKRHNTGVPEEILSEEYIASHKDPDYIENRDGSIEWDTNVGDELEKDIVKTPKKNDNNFSINKNLMNIGDPDGEVESSVIPVNKDINPLVNYKPKEYSTPIVSPKDSITKIEREVADTMKNSIRVQNETKTITVNSSTDLREVISIMTNIMTYLQNIVINTNDSANELNALNQKEFVDNGVRNTIKALGSTKQRSYRSGMKNSAIGVSKMSRV